MTNTKLTPDYIKTMFGQFLSVAVKNDGRLSHNIFIPGAIGCGKLNSLIEILKERNISYKIFDATRTTNLESVMTEAVEEKSIVIIDDVSSSQINRDNNLSTKLKELMEKRTIILVCHSTDEEKNYDWNYNSVVDRCLVFHFPSIEI